MQTQIAVMRPIQLYKKLLIMSLRVVFNHFLACVNGRLTSKYSLVWGSTELPVISPARAPPLWEDCPLEPYQCQITSITGSVKA